MTLTRRDSLKGTLAAGLSIACGSRQGSIGWASRRAPSVRSNQLGYFPRGPKHAVVRSSAQAPLPVRLLSGKRVLWQGRTRVLGFDEASGDSVHHLDFSEVMEPGESLVLECDGDESFPFAIGDDIYQGLPRDALKYFYHNRSGVPIVTPYVPEQTWTRPAGHLSDADVGCWGAQACTYRLDVSGGWYDAGDHGKYVVNGGISVWTLLNLFERFQVMGDGRQPFPDASLNIPESGDGVPDILSETRFELEFLLKMQVPSGELAGMVHHKIHDASWTALAMEPPSHAQNRALHPPSTAATLNLAAVGAQAARIFRAYDEAFADRCLAAAQLAFVAAEKHPTRFASPMDNSGGGPYDDRFVSDEFFWAAVELAITTGHPAYFQRVRASPHFRDFPTRLELPNGSFDGDGVSVSFSWQSTAALGWISLALLDSELPAADKQRLRRGVIAAGDAYAEILEKEGYLVPLGLGESKKYPWGSNSCVLNNLIVLALASDFSGERKYAAAAATGMNYLLGTNPLLQSYITGYGAIPLQHPHHRFWADQLSGRFPPPPPGAVSGGPNSSLQDPQTKKRGLHVGLPPQKCFVDDIEAWSVNEVTINWNAPLTWVAAFLDDWRGGT